MEGDAPGSDTAYIDTNIFLRFLIFDKENSSFSEKSKKIIERASKGDLTVVTNSLVVAEVVYVLEKYYELDAKEVFSKLMPLLRMECLLVDSKEKLTAALLLYRDNGVDFEDAYTYADMLEKEIYGIFTFDKKHFQRFEGITILN